MSTPFRIRADVDRGLEIVERIKALSEELDEIEARLEAAGLEGEQIELVDADREGRQFLAKGTEQIVPIIFTADLVTQSFQYGSAKHGEMEAAADGHLTDFYKVTRTFKSLFESGKIFRMKALEILGEKGPAFITACLARDKRGIPKSATRIEWDRTEKI